MFGKLKVLVILPAGIAGAPHALAQQAHLSSPDLILINAKILTMDGPSSVVEALAVRDDKIPEDQIKDIKADVTIVGGKLVFQR